MAADIHGLEIEFAKNPSLDNCIPLCEAYISAKRFMEAMVVCKKGIKTAPADPRGRVMLARVYADQGKLPKAEQELTGMLTEFPNNPLAFEMLGQVLIKQGRQQEAVPLLQQAVGSDPTRALARGLLQQLGMGAPAPVMAPPQAPPPMQAPPLARPPAAPPQGYAMPQGQVRPPMQPLPSAMRPPAMAPHAPQAFGQPGAPQPWGQPNMVPGMQPPAFGMPQTPMGQPSAVAQNAPAGFAVPAAPAEAAPKLEHVSDFFSQEALGFAHDASQSEVETAGPGRLTILGFVPKNTGSIKTTIFVALGVFAIAAALIFWQYYKGQNTRQINKLYGELKIAMDEDRYNRYQVALRHGEDILKIDDSHAQTLGAMAYTYAILANDHGEEGALDKARQYLQRAENAQKEDTEFRVAARALVRYLEKDYDKGIAETKAVMDKGGSGPLVELEAFRLMTAAKTDERDLQKQMARMRQLLVNQVRAFVYLGWYYYALEDWSNADKFFAQAQQNSKDHPDALIGKALTDLDRGIGLRELQTEITNGLKKVFVLPKDEISPPIAAKAHFARAQLLQWQGKLTEADADYKEAFKIQPDNASFLYGRGVQQLKLGMFKEAVDNLRKAAQADANNVRYFKKLGDAQIRVGDAAGAKASLDRAAQFAPKDPELKLLAADLLYASKKYDDAIAAYKAVPEDAPADMLGQAAIGIARSYRDSARKPKSVEHLMKFMEQAPAIGPEMTAKLWCELGISYDETKDKDKAQECFNTGVEQYRFYPECHYYMCRSLGPKDPSAKEACSVYLALDPKGQFAADAIKRGGRMEAAQAGGGEAPRK